MTTDESETRRRSARPRTRRRFLTAAGTAGAVALAGCTAERVDDGG
ncbi:twin-arginine translocation signal domain-containing protein, partial [Halobellus sp. Atlit-38R]